MIATCNRCDAEFESSHFRGYCDDCVAFYRQDREDARERQRKRAESLGAVHVTGKFNTVENCPQTANDPVSGQQVCGLCGSDEIDPGYGYAGGYGLGGYNFCMACGTVMDFSEDTGE